ncbi:hypothetical protein BASA50_006194 [Batrachochytrium salamandrivorans]|uniref:peptidylprolyl isomerase n=1 Tax=Batrachochytrium salamandrivorans TaxID=1357716 RepID=A0ABQ8FAM2_9FUNG|nr:hypothetical protein BASA50_006194 [Batrachochytrium salamandrivorans]KAH9276552.1 hypothetical protein BASA83_000680 [Batrachochytrium salamandrivorans]
MNPRCFLDIDLDGVKAGRLVFELFADRVPKTVENFRALCTGERGRSNSGALLWLKGSKFHRVIKDFMIQGGDFTRGDGTGGESIYGGPFTDEDLTIKHDVSCLLSMANRGPGTNGSQFFITSKAVPHLDGKHVVFGRLVSGTKLFRQMENIPTDKKDRPYNTIEISNCGELECIVPAKSATATSQSVMAVESLKPSSTSKTSKSRHSSGVESSNIEGSNARGASDSDSDSNSSSEDGSSSDSENRRKKSRDHSRSSKKTESLKQRSKSSSKKSRRGDKKRSRRHDSNHSSDSDVETTKQSKKVNENVPSDEDLYAMPLPDDWVEQKSFLDRHSSSNRPFTAKKTHPPLEKDASGRQVKGRGNLRFDGPYGDRRRR